jgi:uroporphyrinogen decarboxylase
MDANDLFLRACRREPALRTPVWFMRQAGRYQPEYRALREQHGILEICRTPDLAAQVTALPVEQLGVDAAILFSDIVVPVAAMGIELDIVEGRGPVIAEPIRDDAGVGRLRVLEPDADVPFVLEAVRSLGGSLAVPLIGFAGAPFTLASYLVEGGPSKDYARTKALMWSSPATWDRLMTILASSMGAYLRAQVEAGAAAVQLFDSWVGALTEEDYRERVLPYSTRVLDAVAGVPRIHFGVGAAHLLEAIRDAGADVVGVDWRTPIDVAWKRLGDGVAVQGNLDPAAVLASPEALRRNVLGVIDAAGGRAGHVFNLGHGVLPATDPAALRSVVELVHERTERPA